MAERPTQDRNPYETAPKDGTPVLLWGDDEGPYLMRWDAAGFNPLVSTVPGIWISVDGGFTWCDERPAGAPTHWAAQP